MNHRTSELVEKVWDYCLLHQPLKKADMIFALGSHDIRVAERAAELYRQGWAPLVVFSGGFSQRKSPSTWERSEADIFAEVAMANRVPAKAILKEDRAGNTGENVLFTRELLKKKNIRVQRLIAVQKPYMERRTYATIRQRWPEVEVIVTSPQLPFKDYVNERFPADHVINIMVGDLQRLKVYGEKGWSTPQEIPTDVWSAYEELVKLGYNTQLVKP